MAILINYNFKDHVSGGRFNQWLARWTTDVVGTEPIDLTGCQVHIWHRKDNERGRIMAKWSLGDTLSMTGEQALDGTFSIDAHTITLPAGRYHYDCAITFPDGDRRVWFRGHWDILTPVTDA